MSRSISLSDPAATRLQTQPRWMPVGFWLSMSAACGLWAMKLFTLASSSHTGSLLDVTYTYPAMMSGLALTALLATLLGRRLTGALPALFVLSCLLYDAAMTSYMAGWSSLEADQLALMFLFLCLVFRGSMLVFWLVVLPPSLLALYSPMAGLEGSGHATLLMLLRAALAPTIALIAGSTLVSIRDVMVDLKRSGEEMKGFAKRGKFISEKIQSIERELRGPEATAQPSVAGEVLATTAPDADIPTLMETLEFETVNPMQAHVPTETLSYMQIHDILKSFLDERRQQLRPTSTLRLALTAAVDLSLPLAIRVHRVSLERVLASMLDQAIESLGGGYGFVRVTLKPGLSEVSILIEDNGRGFNENLLARAGGVSSERLRFTEARDEIEKVGGRMELNARLGVGSRVVIELPRVDAMSRSNMVSRPIVRVPTNDSTSQHG